MNIDDLLQSLPSREDLTNAISRYNTSNWTSSSNSSTTDLLPALGIFGTGMLLGAGLAILFAPKPGSELRRDISDKLSEYGGQAREMAEQGRQMASEYGEQAKQMASEYGEQARQMAGQSGQHGDQMSQGAGRSSQPGSTQHGSTQGGGLGSSTQTGGISGASGTTSRGRTVG
ncbi:MAG TPA: YtxH domain-containing protein [Candidatus Binatia bacterium]|nr:YtxH domain-containing protein [Candidatus Binatia bacterium]